MATKMFKIPAQTTLTSNGSPKFNPTVSPSLSFLSSTQLQQNHRLSVWIPRKNDKCLPFNPTICSLSSSDPPTTKDEAILQAKTCLLSTLEKPLNNPRLTGKLKRLRQPRLRVEIPIIDDSSASQTQLAFEIFGKMPIRRRGGQQIKILVLWQDQKSSQDAVKVFEPHQSSDILVRNMSISSVLDEDVRTLNSSDVAVFFTPDTSEFSYMKTVSECMYPKPVVIFNPKWTFDEEANFDEMVEFLSSFEVVYSFTGLEVRGILSKRKGIIFKCVSDGVLSGEKWNVFVEEEGKLRVVSRFKARPSMAEVENVLYNLMAMNSPVTKSAKFLKDLVSNVTGKK